MHACRGACTWVGVPGQQGGAGLSEWVKLRVGTLVCLAMDWVLQEEAQDILADQGLSSGSEAEMGWVPWNLQKGPTWTNVGQY